MREAWDKERLARAAEAQDKLYKKSVVSRDMGRGVWFSSTAAGEGTWGVGHAAVRVNAHRVPSKANP